MAARKTWCPDRRDMIWINCNPQAGREMKDMHPLLVLSPKEFNERTGIVIGLPMTTAASNDTNPFAVKLRAPKVWSVISSAISRSHSEMRNRTRGRKCRRIRMLTPAKR